MAWIEPIVDRTWSDISEAKRLKEEWRGGGGYPLPTTRLKGCLNVDDINRLIDNMGYIASEIDTRGWGRPSITLPSKKVINSILHATDVQALRVALNGLKTALDWIWRVVGELPETPLDLMHFEEWNDFEMCLLMMKRYLDAEADSVLTLNNMVDNAERTVFTGYANNTSSAWGKVYLDKSHMYYAKREVEYFGEIDTEKSTARGRMTTLSPNFVLIPAYNKGRYNKDSRLVGYTDESAERSLYAYGCHFDGEGHTVFKNVIILNATYIFGGIPVTAERIDVLLDIIGKDYFDTHLVSSEEYDRWMTAIGFDL